MPNKLLETAYSVVNGIPDAGKDAKKALKAQLKEQFENNEISKIQEWIVIQSNLNKGMSPEEAEAIAKGVAPTETAPAPKPTAEPSNKPIGKSKKKETKRTIYKCPRCSFTATDKSQTVKGMCPRCVVDCITQDI